MQTFASGHRNEQNESDGRDVQKQFENWNSTARPNLEDSADPKHLDVITADFNVFSELNGDEGIEPDLLFGFLRGE